MKERDRPSYQLVNGHRLPAVFSEEVFLSGLRYKPSPTDIVVNTFPKCGTHWVTEIVKALLETCRGVKPGTTFLEKLGLAGVESLPHPRIVFTHLPYRLTPHSESTKYIYVARNPKDCCVSFYHHTRTLGYNFSDGTFDEYFPIFLEGLTDFGSYYESLKVWYSHKDDPNVLFVTYESLHADKRGSVLRIAKFLGEDIEEKLKYDKEKMDAVLEAMNFDTMKKELHPPFIRKGVVGDWKNYFSEEQSKKLEERFFSEMKGTDIPDLWKDVDWIHKTRSTMSDARKPIFQLVDGVKIPLGFSPESLRSCLLYKPSPGDIFIDTFPKCGTNWAKRIVQLLLERDTSDSGDYGLSTSFFEMVGKDVIQSLPEPRIICTHLEYQLLPQHPDARYIYIVRNPKDCCVSFFHHTRKTKVYEFENGTFDEYLELFIRGETSYGDYFSHFVSWYPKRNSPNVLYLTYEAMKKNPTNAVLQISDFLDIPDPELRNGSSEKMKALVEACSVDSMRQYLKVNYDKTMVEMSPEQWTAKKDYPLDRAPPPPDAMVRKGIIGDWKNHFSREQSKKIEHAFAEKCGGVADVNQVWDPQDWMEDS